MTAGGETLFGEWSDTSQGCAPWKQQVNSPINTHRQPVYKKKIVIGCQVLPEMFIISHLQPNPWVRDMSLMPED